MPKRRAGGRIIVSSVSILRASGRVSSTTWIISPSAAQPPPAVCFMSSVTSAKKSSCFAPRTPTPDLKDVTLCMQERGTL
uniref:Putative secreted protein n=1 Tax=Ixodes ricinus TaxID=34613 RepID=A0A6B0TXQ5_IXORI